MKNCFYCNKEFEIINKHGGQNRIFCYECLPQGLSKYDGNKLRESLCFSLAKKEKLSRGCDVCGYNKCEHALEWHHKDETTKNAHPGNLRHGDWKKYKEETDKCYLLCANCHREIHYGFLNL